MKSFENNMTGIMVPDETAPGKLREATVTDLIKQAVNQIPQGGFSPEEMRARFRVLNAIDGSVVGATVSLEDADALKLKELVKQFRGFSGVTKSAIDFYDLIEQF